jgi:ribosome recycling factor
LGLARSPSPRLAAHRLRHLGVIKQQRDRILITPFDKVNVPPIVGALTAYRLTAHALDPSTVSASVPLLSGEQHAEIAKHVQKLGEDADFAIRAIRQEARQRIAVTGRGSHRGVQEATDAAGDTDLHPARVLAKVVPT